MSKLRRVAAQVLPRKYKEILRNVVHPAQRFALARRLSKSGQDLGVLSVVIPVSNVAEYVAECLTSVISQSYPRLEIIVVDDGSTDSSMEIVAGFAKYDKRISMVTLENGGNGRARSIGIAAATGEYLTIADSDDVVAPGAYALMMSTLSRSNSDFVLGSAMKFVGKKPLRTNVPPHVHAHERIGISLDEFPDVIEDTFLWNKVFRKSFWNESQPQIPEVVQYNDQEATARAYVRAASFDIVSQVVYYWRQRSNGSAIAQEQPSKTDLQDLLTASHNVSQLLVSESTNKVLDKWFVGLLGTNLIPYYERVPYEDERYWHILVAGVRYLSEIMSTSIKNFDGLNSRMDPHARVLLSMATAGLGDEFEQVLVDRMETGTGFKVLLRDGNFYAVPNYSAMLPSFLGVDQLQIDPCVLQLDSQILVRGWGDNGDLLLSGHSFVRGLPDSKALSLLVSVAPGLNGKNWQELAVLPKIDENFDARTNDVFASHQRSVFSLRVPASILAETPDEKLRVKILFTVSAHTYEAIHEIQIPNACSELDKQYPHVCGFSAMVEPEGFCIDVQWGDASPANELYLATQQQRLDPVRKRDLGANTVRYVFELAGTAWGRSIYAPQSGAYTLRYVMEGAYPSSGICGSVIRPTAQTAWKLPIEARLEHAYVQGRVTQSGSFVVAISAPLRSDERGKFWQRSLQAIFETDQKILNDSVVFESFGGKTCTDSPKALSDELHAMSPSKVIYWSIVDYSVSYPEYAIPLIRGSREWYEKLSTCKYLINNNNFPYYFRKSKGQFYLQTWHGTPMKKIGLDAPIRYISPSYRRLMAREATYWDLLLAQNEFSREILPKALGYQGNLLTEGYPRNDLLVRKDSERTASSTRRLLGLREDQIAVLYAPTWRDTAKDSNGAHKLVGHIDFGAAQVSLDDSTIFLMRGHHNVLDRRTTLECANVIDVSAYPEINDLILASDILITDYSSIMFDYNVTGKPIYFLLADLDDYQSNVRGLYLTHDEANLGEKLLSSEDVVQMLLTIGRRNSNSLQEKSRFVAYDDGQTSGRVMNLLASRMFRNDEVG